MFQIKKPIRIGQQSEDRFLISLPSIGKRIEVNQNVLQFLQFLIEKENITDDITQEFTEKFDIINKSDYDEILDNMKTVGLLIEV